MRFRVNWRNTEDREKWGEGMFLGKGNYETTITKLEGEEM